MELEVDIPKRLIHVIFASQLATTLAASLAAIRLLWTALLRIPVKGDKGIFESIVNKTILGQVLRELPKR